jgi:hypothetical protein
VLAQAYVGGLGVQLNIVVEAGQPVLSDVLIERGDDLEGPLTSSAIRDVPIDEVVRQVVAGAAWHMTRQDGGHRIPGEVAPKPKEGWLITEAHLREVAAVVRGAVYGEQNKAVVARFGVSPRTASRWIAAANKLADDEGSDQR